MPVTKPKFLFSQMDEVWDSLPEEYKEAFAWQYEVTKDPMLSVMVHGVMVAHASLNPTATYWEILKEAKQDVETRFATVDAKKVGSA